MFYVSTLEMTREEIITHLSCPICQYECTRSRKLKKHFQKNHSEFDLLHCTFCEYVTINNRAIKRHKKSVHPLERFSCTSCQFSSKRWTAWSHHIKMQHPDGHLGTFVQTKAFSTHRKMKQEDLLSDHKLIEPYATDSIQDHSGNDGVSPSKKVKMEFYEHDIKLEASLQTSPVKSTMTKSVRDKENAVTTSTIVCLMCPYECKKYKMLIKHYKKKHKGLDVLLCPFCEYVTINLREMKKHKKELHPNDYMSCSNCDFSTKKWKKWARHMRTGHQLAQASMSPLFKKNSSSQNFRVHSTQVTDQKQSILSLHSKGKTVKLDDKDCISTSGSKNTPIKNKELVKCAPSHDTKIQENVDTSSLSSIDCHSNARNFNCGQCKKTFKTSGQLLKHVHRHTMSKLYQCSVCHFSTKYSGNLKEHMLMHADIKPYSCSVCQKSFAQMRTFEQHKITHSEDRPHQCQFCKYAAKDKTTLQQHLRGHLNIKPYKCIFCDFATAYRGTLKYHTMVHKGERPFTCSFCDKTFVNGSNMRKHIDAKHSDPDQEIHSNVE